MRFMTALRRSGRTMRRKLFLYMLSLAFILLATLFTALLLFGRYSSAQHSLADTLDLQLDFYQREVQHKTDSTAVMSIELSRDLTGLLEGFLVQNGLSFGQLENNPEALAAFQTQALPCLKARMMQTDCSGAFFMLDATVNTQFPDAGFSRSGMYLQRVSSSDDSLLLYRGRPEVGKQYGVMPHRKWRLEFRTDLFPTPFQRLLQFNPPLESAYRLSGVFTLPGTSEQAVLMTLPLVGENGSVYGICGFEISQSYFKATHAQPTRLPHLTFVLTDRVENTFDPQLDLTCGTADGYFLSPSEPLELSALGSRLTAFSGSTRSFVGLTRSLSLTPNNHTHTLAVLMPRQDYSHMVAANALQLLQLSVLLLFFTVSCCIYFSRRFLSPVLKDLEQIRCQEHEEKSSSGLQEIDDLFGFLARQDQQHEQALRTLEHQRMDAQRLAENMQDRCDRIASDYESAQAEVARLSYDRSRETDPEEYRIFREGIRTLTPAEYDIFRYYMEGKTVKDILAIANIKESTLRYHNRNIYSKLGVNSLRQLLRFATLMQHSTEPDPK